MEEQQGARDMIDGSCDALCDSKGVLGDARRAAAADTQLLLCCCDVGSRRASADDSDGRSVLLALPPPKSSPLLMADAGEWSALSTPTGASASSTNGSILDVPAEVGDRSGRTEAAGK